MCFARRWDNSPISAVKPLPQLIRKMVGDQVQKHLEGCGGDCDRVGDIYFLQHVLNDLPPLFSILCKSLPGVYTDVCSLHMSSSWLHLCITAIVHHEDVSLWLIPHRIQPFVVHQLFGTTRHFALLVAFLQFRFYLSYVRRLSSSSDKISSSFSSNQSWCFLVVCPRVSINVWYTFSQRVSHLLLIVTLYERFIMLVSICAINIFCIYLRICQFTDI